MTKRMVGNREVVYQSHCYVCSKSADETFSTTLHDYGLCNRHIREFGLSLAAAGYSAAKRAPADVCERELDAMKVAYTKPQRIDPQVDKSCEVCGGKYYSVWRTKIGTKCYDHVLCSDCVDVWREHQNKNRGSDGNYNTYDPAHFEAVKAKRGKPPIAVPPWEPKAGDRVAWTDVTGRYWTGTVKVLYSWDSICLDADSEQGQFAYDKKDNGWWCGSHNCNLHLLTEAPATPEPSKPVVPAPCIERDATGKITKWIPMVGDVVWPTYLEGPLVPMSVTHVTPKMVEVDGLPRGSHTMWWLGRNDIRLDGFVDFAPTPHEAQRERERRPEVVDAMSPCWSVVRIGYDKPKPKRPTNTCGLLLSGDLSRR